ncbi:hypothetical protein C8Q73DRAFT_666345 [Cubamyces lactineus]|nr:hypothetical protein C8Q73DRAFT_666345 [Cubamyces lactineus]
MFPRGPRFPAAKAPEVPGPGAYNPQDPDYDAYKRGAFLEKTNRFDKDKPSDVPAVAYGVQDQEHTMWTPRVARTNLRLQKHKAPLTDFLSYNERLKLELSRAQRTAAEATERAEKLKKQNDALDARVQELKKTNANDQTELRELRVRLRTSEHERTQLASKHNDAGEARKALQAAETRRKDELRERDRKIADLERTLSMERKKREAAETKWQEARSKTDDRVQEARTAAQNLEAQLQETQREAQAAQQALRELEARAEDTEEELLAKLEQHRTMLARVAEEYGRLASTSIALSVHQRVKQEVAALQLRSNRLERKLANSEGQVVELASLIRQVRDENSFLSSQLCEARHEADTCRHALRDSAQSSASHEAFRDLDDDLVTVAQSQLACESEKAAAIQTDLGLWGTLDRLQRDSLIFQSSVLTKALGDSLVELDQRAKDLSVAEATQAQLSESLQRAQTDHAETQRMLAELTASLAEAKAHEESYKKQLEAVKAESRAEVARVEQNLQREKEASQRLSAALYKAKQAEQFLRSEVEQLSSDLTEAEKYEEAYNNLLQEVDALVLRNALAEEEALRLSKYNAEILGHHNPAQRIMYVDRIRRELHETKQKLLISTRDCEAVIADNEELRHELELYKSVGVPHEIKPRTTITRVGRGPASLSDSDLRTSLPSGQALPHSASSSAASRLTSVPELPSGSCVDGDMTLDEIM